MSEFLDTVTDLFPANKNTKCVEKLAPENSVHSSSVLPSVSSDVINADSTNLICQQKGKCFETDNFVMAVALLCAGWASPDLTPIGRNTRGKLRVRFSFALPPGQKIAAIEEKFRRKEYRADVERVFSEGQALKAKIYRLSCTLKPNTLEPKEELH